jgi:hypothetical protein
MPSYLVKFLCVLYFNAHGNKKQIGLENILCEGSD